MTKPQVGRGERRLVVAVSAVVLLVAAASPAVARAMPEIRTSPANAVPACVTPDRLMAFLRSRNGRLSPRYKDIAKNYKTYGEAWRVRWDYAFFQMAVETNFLSYRQPNGRMGDVDPEQNNFAGIGTTGGGVPGDSFPDVKTGVHAQIQHLVVYSGERLAAPIAPRTQLKQDDILKASLELERPVRWNDLARRWAVDRNYDKSIEWVAGLYRSRYCQGRQAAEVAPAEPVVRVAAVADAAPRQAAAPEPRPAAAPRSGTPTAHPAVRTVWVRSPQGRPLPESMPSPAVRVRPVAALVPAAARASRTVEPSLAAEPAAPSAVAPQTAPPASAPAAAPATGTGATAPPARPPFDPAKSPPAGLGAPGMTCSIGTASYGGSKSVLIKARDGESVRYTVLSVLEGFEASMTQSFLKARSTGGTAIGEFPSREAAMDMARTLCPGEAG